MAIKITAERQYPLTAVIEVNVVDLVAGTNIAAVLPAGARVTGGSIIVNTVANSTTNTLSIGDSALGTRYATTVDLKTAARTGLTLGAYKHVDATKQLLLTYALTGGAATQGQVTIIVEYVVAGRNHETIG